MKRFFELEQLQAEQMGSLKLYLEFLRVPALSAGLYVLPAGSIDPQRPHKEDEVYYVVRGKARMRVGEENRPVAAGSVIFVEAHMEHRFYDVVEELAVLVFFGPAES